MFGISGEHLVILGIVLVIFGPKRLPELGNTLGKAIRNFKDSMSGVEEAKFRHIAENEARTRAAEAKVVEKTAEEKAAQAAAAANPNDPNHKSS